MGSGKNGGGGAQTPHVAADTLVSTARAHILHALCEGPIEGWSDPDPKHALRCICANGTPIEFAEPDGVDGSGSPKEKVCYNFHNITVHYRLGKPDQTHIENFFLSAEPVGEGNFGAVTKKTAHPTDPNYGSWPGPRTVHFTATDADEVSLRFSLDSLYVQKADYSVEASTVELRVEMRGRRPDPAPWPVDQQGNEIWVDVGRRLRDQWAAETGAPAGKFISPFAKTGKASSRYEWSVRVKLDDMFGPGHGCTSFQVRVSRATEDSADPASGDKTKHYRDTNFDGITIIKNKKLTYPGVALVAIEADASQFGNMPTISFRVKGLIIKVPSNYDPKTRTYTGDWDGSFKPAWSNNPAWCLYDLLTESRYGLGDWVKPEYVDKWELYRIGRYCDEPVPSGRKDKNGADIMEPRFTLNCYIQTQEEAAKIVQLIASAFHAMTYWAAGAVFAAQDRPDGPSFLFTPSNVKGGEFVYSATGRRARHNAAVVQWSNPENSCKMEPELFEMDDRIEELGFRFPLERVAFGCTSRGQALREARLALFTENHQTETVSFGVGMEGAQLRPGDIVAVMDPKRVGKQWGGRVKGHAGNVITLDREVELDEGSHNLILTMAEGRIVEGQVITAAGATDTLTLFQTDVGTAEGAVWMLAGESTAPTLWRVLAVSMQDEGEYAVTALEYVHEKWAWAEQGVEFTDRVAWTGGDFLPRPLYPPKGLALKEYLYRDKKGLRVGVMAGWVPGTEQVLFMPSYRIGRERPVELDAETLEEVGPLEGNDLRPRVTEKRVFSNNWIDMPATSQCFVEIAPIDAPCRIEFSVTAQMRDGRVTPPAYAEMEVLGKDAPPSDVTGFTARCDGTVLTFAWDACPDLDFHCYEIREGADWDTAEALAGGLTANAYTTEIGGTRPATFLIKAMDEFGNWSVNAAAATLQLYDPDDPGTLTPREKRRLAAWRKLVGERIIQDRVFRLGGTDAELQDALAAFDDLMEGDPRHLPAVDGTTALDEAMETIDRRLAALEAESVDTAVGTVASSLTSLSLTIGTMAGDLTTIRTRLGDIEDIMVTGGLMPPPEIGP